MCFRRVVTVFQKGNKCVSEGENSAFRNGSRVFRNGSRAFRPGQKTFRNGTLACFRRTTMLRFGMEVGRALSIFAFEVVRLRASARLALRSTQFSEPNFSLKSCFYSTEITHGAFSLPQ